MKRKITAKLYEWKNMKKGRMPLLIYGARQVGKTFEMREFGALYYKNTVYVNFETDERIGKYFDTDIHAFIHNSSPNQPINCISILRCPCS